MSSFYSDASLVMIPSGYKTSKVYSAVPTDGAGDLSFTRTADTATRVASNGLIEKVRTNLFLYSEQFNNTAAWQYQGGATINANAGIAPNGTTTADLLYPSINGSIVAAIQAITSASSVEYTQSVYVKASGKNFVGLYTFDGTAGTTMWVNLTTGAITNGVGSSVSGRFATNVGNGWWRIGFTDIGNGTTTYMHVYPTDAASSNSVTANGTDGILLWGAQLETGVATDYIGPTTTTAVSVGPVSGLPRLDYLNSTCPRLLLEPQRTNVNLNSETFGASTGTTIVLNNTASPDGYVNADKLVEDTSTGVHITAIGGALGGSVDSSVYSVSVFAKAAGRTRINMFDNNQASAGITNFDIANGVVISGDGKIENYGNGWYRCSIFPAKTNSTNANTQIRLIDSGTNVSYTGNGTSGVYLWGAQVEAGAYATSYIPTLGTSVTRVGDAASKTSASALIGQTEGTIYAEWNASSVSASGRVIAIGDGTFANRIVVLEDGGGIRVFISTSSVVQADISPLGSYVGTHKIAIAYANNDLKVYIDGVAVATATTLSVPPCSALYVGTFENGTDQQPLGGGIAQTLLFKTRLSNSDLATLTTL